MNTQWQADANAEIRAARDALQSGLPGRARVAARRAAGISLAEYNLWRDFTEHTQNYYDLLLAFSTHAGVPVEIREIAQRLCQRVDEAHTLPKNFDLVADAERVISFVAGCIAGPVCKGEQHGEQ
jgi:hypothetical protein